MTTDDDPDRPRPPREGELEALLALNNAHAAELSELTPAALRALLDGAFHARTVGGAGALLIGLDQDAAYASPNFLWFKARYPRFAYVDRVAVAPARRGGGLARRLYAGLFEAAARAGHTLVACEVNTDPPNPGSDAFHERLGFAEVGRAVLADRGKAVRYLVRAVGS